MAELGEEMDRSMLTADWPERTDRLVGFGSSGCSQVATCVATLLLDCLRKRRVRIIYTVYIVKYKPKLCVSK